MNKKIWSIIYSILLVTSIIPPAFAQGTTPAPSSSTEQSSADQQRVENGQLNEADYQNQANYPAILNNPNADYTKVNWAVVNQKDVPAARINEIPTEKVKVNEVSDKKQLSGNQLAYGSNLAQFTDLKQTNPVALNDALNKKHGLTGVKFAFDANGGTITYKDGYLRNSLFNCPLGSTCGLDVNSLKGTGITGVASTSDPKNRTNGFVITGDQTFSIQGTDGTIKGVVIAGNSVLVVTRDGSTLQNPTGSIIAVTDDAGNLYFVANEGSGVTFRGYTITSAEDRTELRFGENSLEIIGSGTIDKAGVVSAKVNKGQLSFKLDQDNNLVGTRGTNAEVSLTVTRPTGTFVDKLSGGFDATITKNEFVNVKLIGKGSHADIFMDDPANKGKPRLTKVVVPSDATEANFVLVTDENNRELQDGKARLISDAMKIRQAFNSELKTLKEDVKNQLEKTGKAEITVLENGNNGWETKQVPCASVDDCVKEFNKAYDKADIKKLLDSAASTTYLVRTFNAATGQYELGDVAGKGKITIVNEQYGKIEVLDDNGLFFYRSKPAVGNEPGSKAFYADTTGSSNKEVVRFTELTPITYTKDGVVYDVRIDTKTGLAYGLAGSKVLDLATGKEVTDTIVRNSVLGQLEVYRPQRVLTYTNDGHLLLDARSVLESAILNDASWTLGDGFAYVRDTAKGIDYNIKIFYGRDATRADAANDVAPAVLELNSDTNQLIAGGAKGYYGETFNLKLGAVDAAGFQVIYGRLQEGRDIASQLGGALAFDKALAPQLAALGFELRKEKDAQGNDVETVYFNGKLVSESIKSVIRATPVETSGTFIGDIIRNSKESPPALAALTDALEAKVLQDHAKAIDNFKKYEAAGGNILYSSAQIVEAHKVTGDFSNARKEVANYLSRADVPAEAKAQIEGLLPGITSAEGSASTDQFVRIAKHEQAKEEYAAFLKKYPEANAFVLQGLAAENAQILSAVLVLAGQSKLSENDVALAKTNAIESAEAAVKANPKDADRIYFQLGTALAASYKKDDLVPGGVFDKQFASLQSDTLKQLKEQVLMVQAGKLSAIDAKPLIDEAIRLRAERGFTPTSTQYRLLGDAAQESGNYDQARQFYVRAEERLGDEATATNYDTSKGFNFITFTIDSYDLTLKEFNAGFAANRESGMSTSIESNIERGKLLIANSYDATKGKNNDNAVRQQMADAYAQLYITTGNTQNLVDANTLLKTAKQTLFVGFEDETSRSERTIAQYIAVSSQLAQNSLTLAEKDSANKAAHQNEAKAAYKDALHWVGNAPEEGRAEITNRLLAQLAVVQAQTGESAVETIKQITDGTLRSQTAFAAAITSQSQDLMQLAAEEGSANAYLWLAQQKEKQAAVTEDSTRRLFTLAAADDLLIKALRLPLTSEERAVIEAARAKNEAERKSLAETEYHTAYEDIPKRIGVLLKEPTALNIQQIKDLAVRANDNSLLSVTLDQLKKYQAQAGPQAGDIGTALDQAVASLQKELDLRVEKQKDAITEAQVRANLYQKIIDLEKAKNEQSSATIVSSEVQKAFADEEQQKRFVELAKLGNDDFDKYLKQKESLDRDLYAQAVAFGEDNAKFLADQRARDRETRLTVSDIELQFEHPDWTAQQRLELVQHEDRLFIKSELEQAKAGRKELVASQDSLDVLADGFFNLIDYIPFVEIDPSESSVDRAVLNAQKELAIQDTQAWIQETIQKMNVQQDISGMTPEQKEASLKAMAALSADVYRAEADVSQHTMDDYFDSREGGSFLENVAAVWDVGPVTLSLQAWESGKSYFGFDNVFDTMQQAVIDAQNKARLFEYIAETGKVSDTAFTSNDIETLTTLGWSKDYVESIKTQDTLRVLHVDGDVTKFSLAPTGTVSGFFDAALKPSSLIMMQFGSAGISWATRTAGAGVSWASNALGKFAQKEGASALRVIIGEAGQAYIGGAKLIVSAAGKTIGAPFKYSELLGGAIEKGLAKVTGSQMLGKTVQFGLIEIGVQEGIFNPAYQKLFGQTPGLEAGDVAEILAGGRGNFLASLQEQGLKPTDMFTVQQSDGKQSAVLTFSTIADLQTARASLLEGRELQALLDAQGNAVGVMTTDGSTRLVLENTAVFNEFRSREVVSSSYITTPTGIGTALEVPADIPESSLRTWLGNTFEKVENVQYDPAVPGIVSGERVTPQGRELVVVFRSGTSVFDSSVVQDIITPSSLVTSASPGPEAVDIANAVGLEVRYEGTITTNAKGGANVKVYSIDAPLIAVQVELAKQGFENVHLIDEQTLEATQNGVRSIIRSTQVPLEPGQSLGDARILAVRPSEIIFETPFLAGSFIVTHIGVRSLENVQVPEGAQAVQGTAEFAGKNVPAVIYSQNGRTVVVTEDVDIDAITVEGRFERLRDPVADMASAIDAVIPGQGRDLAEQLDQQLRRGDAAGVISTLARFELMDQNFQLIPGLDNPDLRDVVVRMRSLRDETARRGNVPAADVDRLTTILRIDTLQTAQRTLRQDIQTWTAVVEQARQVGIGDAMAEEAFAEQRRIETLIAAQQAEIDALIASLPSTVIQEIPTLKPLPESPTAQTPVAPDVARIRAIFLNAKSTLDERITAAEELNRLIHQGKAAPADAEILRPSLQPIQGMPEELELIKIARQTIANADRKEINPSLVKLGSVNTIDELFAANDFVAASMPTGAGNALFDRATAIEKLKDKAQASALIFRTELEGRDVAVKLTPRKEQWDVETLRLSKLKGLVENDRARVPRYYGEFSIDIEGITYYGVVEDYIPGPDLANAVEQSPAFFKGVYDILIDAHAIGITFSDVHTNNVKSSDGQPVIIDWGLGNAQLTLDQVITDIINRQARDEEYDLVNFAQAARNSVNALANEVGVAELPQDIPLPEGIQSKDGVFGDARAIELADTAYLATIDNVRKAASLPESDGVEVATGFTGSGAKTTVDPYPGDIDLLETIVIKGTREEADAKLAQIVQQQLTASSQTLAVQQFIVNDMRLKIDKNGVNLVAGAEPRLIAESANDPKVLEIIKSMIEQSPALIEFRFVAKTETGYRQVEKAVKYAYDDGKLHLRYGIAEESPNGFAQSLPRTVYASLADATLETRVANEQAVNHGGTPTDQKSLDGIVKNLEKEVYINLPGIEFRHEYTENSMKAMKRLASVYTAKGQEVPAELVDLFNSDAGKVYQVASEIGALRTVLRSGQPVDQALVAASLARWDAIIQAAVIDEPQWSETQQKVHNLATQANLLEAVAGLPERIFGEISAHVGLLLENGLQKPALDGIRARGPDYLMSGYSLSTADRLQSLNIPSEKVAQAFPKVGELAIAYETEPLRLAMTLRSLEPNHVDAILDIAKRYARSPSVVVDNDGNMLVGELRRGDWAMQKVDFEIASKETLLAAKDLLIDVPSSDKIVPIIQERLHALEVQDAAAALAEASNRLVEAPPLDIAGKSPETLTQNDIAKLQKYKNDIANARDALTTLRDIGRRDSRDPVSGILNLESLLSNVGTELRTAAAMGVTYAVDVSAMKTNLGKLNSDPNIGPRAADELLREGNAEFAAVYRATPSTYVGAQQKVVVAMTTIVGAESHPEAPVVFAENGLVVREIQTQRAGNLEDIIDNIKAKTPGLQGALSGIVTSYEFEAQPNVDKATVDKAMSQIARRLNVLSKYASTVQRADVAAPRESDVFAHLKEQFAKYTTLTEDQKLALADLIDSISVAQTRDGVVGPLVDLDVDVQRIDALLDHLDLNPDDGAALLELEQRVREMRRDATGADHKFKDIKGDAFLYLEVRKLIAQKDPIIAKKKYAAIDAHDVGKKNAAATLTQINTFVEAGVFDDAALRQLLNTVNDARDVELEKYLTSFGHPLPGTFASQDQATKDRLEKVAKLLAAEDSTTKWTPELLFTALSQSEALYGKGGDEVNGVQDVILIKGQKPLLVDQIFHARARWIQELTNGEFVPGVGLSDKIGTRTFTDVDSSAQRAQLVPKLFKNIRESWPDLQDKYPKLANVNVDSVAKFEVVYDGRRLSGPEQAVVLALLQEKIDQAKSGKDADKLGAFFGDTAAPVWMAAFPLVKGQVNAFEEWKSMKSRAEAKAREIKERNAQTPEPVIELEELKADEYPLPTVNTHDEALIVAAKEAEVQGLISEDAKDAALLDTPVTQDVAAVALPAGESAPSGPSIFARAKGLISTPWLTIATLFLTPSVANAATPSINVPFTSFKVPLEIGGISLQTWLFGGSSIILGYVGYKKVVLPVFNGIAKVRSYFSSGNAPFEEVLPKDVPSKTPETVSTPDGVPSGFDEVLPSETLAPEVSIEQLSENIQPTVKALYESGALTIFDLAEIQKKLGDGVAPEVALQEQLAYRLYLRRTGLETESVWTFDRFKATYEPGHEAIFKDYANNPELDAKVDSALAAALVAQARPVRQIDDILFASEVPAVTVGGVQTKETENKITITKKRAAQPSYAAALLALAGYSALCELLKLPGCESSLAAADERLGKIDAARKTLDATPGDAETKKALDDMLAKGILGQEDISAEVLAALQKENLKAILDIIQKQRNAKAKKAVEDAGLDTAAKASAFEFINSYADRPAPAYIPYVVATGTCDAFGGSCRGSCEEGDVMVLKARCAFASVCCA